MATCSSIVSRGIGQATTSLGAGGRGGVGGDVDDLHDPLTGRLVDASKLRKRFTRAVERAGLHVITFHELRDTFGTQMAAARAPPRAIQEWMGHATRGRPRSMRTTRRTPRPAQPLPSARLGDSPMGGEPVRPCAPGGQLRDNSGWTYRPSPGVSPRPVWTARPTAQTSRSGARAPLRRLLLRRLPAGRQRRGGREVLARTPARARIAPVSAPVLPSERHVAVA